MKNKTATARDGRALDPWAFPSPRQDYDVRKLVRSFETVGKAKAERDLRVRHLRTAGSTICSDEKGQLGIPPVTRATKAGVPSMIPSG